MSVTKFIIERTGEHFFYDNQTNGLLDPSGTALSRPWTEPEHWDDLKDRFGSTSIAKNPETIKITLGHGCNYSCGYCMQKDIGNPDERPVNGLTPMLIKNIRRHLDLSGVKRIELWGGETLLYWRDIVSLMEEFDQDGLEWYIPTNGTPLMHKHVDFFTELKGHVAIGISHDGPGHESTRGPEFLHKKVDVLRRIQRECSPDKLQFSFNPVISRTNYDLFAINDFFRTFLEENNLDPVSLSYELGRVYDASMAQNSTHHVISGADLPLYADLLQRYLDANVAQFKERGTTRGGNLLINSLFHYGSGVLPYARTLEQQKVPLLRTNCGVDDKRLISMDMMGNVHTCQNTDDSFIGGNLMHIKGIRIKRVDLNRDDHCGSCHVRRLCHSSCPLDLGIAVLDTNCAVEKLHYSAIQRTAFKILFDSEISKAVE